MANGDLSLSSSAKNILYDCDNTFGIEGRDVDDGLALLYLLGSPNARLLGISCCYGNGDVDLVYRATKKMLADIGRRDLPVLKGCAGTKDRSSEASDFLVEEVDRHAGDISLLATGSLSNLYGAFIKDLDFFKKLSEVVLMGGLTMPLVMKGGQLDELNFSCDAEASHAVIRQAENLAIATGNNCLDAFFPRADYERRLGSSGLPIAGYIRSHTATWYDRPESSTKDGFITWDVVAAAYLMDRSLFFENESLIAPTVDSLARGFLVAEGAEPLRVRLPRIRAAKLFEEAVYGRYLAVPMAAKQAGEVHHAS